MPVDSMNEIPVDSRKKWNDTGFDVVKDREYEVTVTGEWQDKGHSFGPEGWPGSAIMRRFTWLRRSRRFLWGALIGSVDQRKPYVHIMPGRFRPPATGRLFCFFNDARGFYGNNAGSLGLTISAITTGTGAPAAAKSIVLFSDGTGNSSAKLFKTNVWRMYEAVDLGPPADDRRPQISYYDDGVGTSSFRPLAILGGAFGSGLKRNVLDIYRYACRNYRDGDDIYASGFSRGAFTIRLVVALIASQGLVRSDSEAELKRKSVRAYSAFRASMLPRRLKWPTRLFRSIRAATGWLTGQKTHDPAENSHPPIRFVGVWDTVSAYGGPIIEITRAIDNWIYALSMPNYQLHERVLCARHALALDDQRESFHPLLWDEVHEASLVRAKKVETDRLKQVWFTGMHSDVGGGYPDESLSYVSLLWMMNEAEQAGLRTLRVIKDRFVALASSCGPLHDSRSGLAAYYRYQPLKIAAWLHPVDRRTLSLRDPAIVDAAGRPCGLLLHVNVHESVINRIAMGTDRYAPIALPEAFRIVPELGAETRPQADSASETPRPEIPATKPMVSRETRERLEEAATARAHATETVWDFVWWRRITYFATLGATLLLLALPLVEERLPTPPILSDGRTGIGGPIRLIAILLPDFAADWVDVYADNPFYFLLLAVLIAALLSVGNRFERKLRAEARHAWMRTMDALPLAPPHVSLIQRLRNGWAYQHVVKFIKWVVLPDAVVAPVIGLLLLWLGLAVYVQFRLPFLENDTLLCGQRSTATRGSRGDFRTRDVCSGSFGAVEKGIRYVVTFEIVDPWYDASITTSPKGLGVGDFPSIAGYIAAPWRRAMNARFLQPVLEVRPTDGDHFTGHSVVIYPIALEPVGESTSLYRGEFDANRTGEMFLFANDAMIPLTSSWWGEFGYRYFYEKSGSSGSAEVGNRGTACVTITPVNAVAAPMGEPPAGSICAEAAMRRPAR